MGRAALSSAAGRATCRVRSGTQRHNRGPTGTNSEVSGASQPSATPDLQPGQELRRPKAPSPCGAQEIHSQSISEHGFAPSGDPNLCMASPGGSSRLPLLQPRPPGTSFFPYGCPGSVPAWGLSAGCPRSWKALPVLPVCAPASPPLSHPKHSEVPAWKPTSARSRPFSPSTRSVCLVPGGLEGRLFCPSRVPSCQTAAVAWRVGGYLLDVRLLSHAGALPGGRQGSFQAAESPDPAEGVGPRVPSPAPK